MRVVSVNGVRRSRFVRNDGKKCKAGEGDFADQLIAARMTEEQADVAQLVEQLIRNQQVSGSSPLVGSIESVVHGDCCRRSRFAVTKSVTISDGRTFFCAFRAAMRITKTSASQSKGARTQLRGLKSAAKCVRHCLSCTRSLGMRSATSSTAHVLA
jgi:hypothetical protein